MITAILFNLLNMLGLNGAGIIVAVLKLLGMIYKRPGRGEIPCPAFFNFHLKSQRPLFYSQGNKTDSKTAFCRHWQNGIKAALGLTESHKK